jgi:lysozyme-like protein/ricin-type beta-trefoil lectin protein
MLAFVVRLKPRAVLPGPVVRSPVVRCTVVRNTVVRSTVVRSTVVLGTVVRSTVVLGTVAVLFTSAAAAAGTTPQIARVTSAAQVTPAAQTCASYATAAGWANNGSLVTASAVCMAESGGQAAVYYCDATGHDGDYPPVKCPGVYDRGLWQLDSAGQSAVTDACAFAPQCNADAAYVVSARGSSFAAWSVYVNGVYTSYVGAARDAVQALTSGTVASGVAGVCLARGPEAANAPVITGRCGTGAAGQQWGVPGAANLPAGTNARPATNARLSTNVLAGTIRSGPLCAAPASTAPDAAVRLRRCDGLAWQQWAQSATGELRNAQTGECLRDPGGSLVPGIQVTVAPCAAYPAGTWWLS